MFWTLGGPFLHFEVPALYESKMGLTWVPIPLAPLVNKTFLTRGIVREIWDCRNVSTDSYYNWRDKQNRNTQTEVWEIRMKSLGNRRDMRMSVILEPERHENERGMRMRESWVWERNRNGRDMRLRETWEWERHENERDMGMGETREWEWVRQENETDTGMGEK